VWGRSGTRTELTRRRLGRINRDVFVFAFFVFLSFIFWYLNSLDNEIEAGIRYPVRFTNIPRQREIVDKQPVRLNLFLKGPGSSILKLKLTGKRTPLIIDISKVNYKRIAGTKELQYYIITSGLAKSFSVQLRTDSEITSIKPDTLFFTLEKTNPGTSSGDGKKSLFGRVYN
jgi:hypothetical protein